MLRPWDSKGKEGSLSVYWKNKDTYETEKKNPRLYMIDDIITYGSVVLLKKVLNKIIKDLFSS